MECSICGEKFGADGEQLNLCQHQEGFVHLDCCAGRCSGHGGPCDHCIGIYSRL